MCMFSSNHFHHTNAIDNGCTHHGSALVSAMFGTRPSGKRQVILAMFAKFERFMK